MLSNTPHAATSNPGDTPTPAGEGEHTHYRDHDGVCIYCHDIDPSQAMHFPDAAANVARAMREAVTRAALDAARPSAEDNRREVERLVDVVTRVPVKPGSQWLTLGHDDARAIVRAILAAQEQS